MLDFGGREMRIQYFDGGTGPKIDMLAHINICEASVPKQANKAIMTNLLTDAVGHTYTFQGATPPFSLEKDCDLFSSNATILQKRTAFWRERHRAFV